MNASIQEAKVHKAFAEARRQCWHVCEGTGRLLLGICTVGSNRGNSVYGNQVSTSLFRHLKKKWFSISETCATKTTTTKTTTTKKGAQGIGQSNSQKDSREVPKAERTHHFP